MIRNSERCARHVTHICWLATNLAYLALLLPFAQFDTPWRSACHARNPALTLPRRCCGIGSHEDLV